MHRITCRWLTFLNHFPGSLVDNFLTTNYFEMLDILIFTEILKLAASKYGSSVEDYNNFQ